MTFDLPPGVKRIRIDPPPLIPLVISNLRATQTTPISNQQLEIARLPLMIHQMEQYGTFLQSFGGNDPYFAWDIPNSPRENIKTAWHLTASVQVVSPILYKNFLRPNIAKLVKSTLLERGDSAAFQRFTLMLDQQTGLLR